VKQPTVEQNTIQQQEEEIEMATKTQSLSSKIGRASHPEKKEAEVRLVRSKTENAGRMFKREKANIQQIIITGFAKNATQWFNRRPNLNDEDLEKEIRDTLGTFNRFLIEWRLDHLLMPALIYVERYFMILKKINDQFIFDLFMTSVILAIKMWHDQIITNATYSKLFDIPTHILCYNELNFLHAVDYDLLLCEEDVRKFKRRFLLPDDVSLPKEKC
jgi:hypothetical protein